MPRIVLDFDPPQNEAPAFASDTSDLVYFLSWAFSTRYGANHELSIAALVLRGEYGIDLSPLLTYADRSVEDQSDADELERAWQDAAPLAECCEKIAQALSSDDARLSDIRDEYSNLKTNIEELGRIVRWAAGQDVRIRVTYVLEDEA